MKKPMRMEPVYRDYLWGGEKLREWGKTSPLSPLAESWEVSCRADGASRDRETGRTLLELLREDPSLQGVPGEFPLLLKLIDAAKNLSVQVHPSDALARSKGQPFGKTECWVVLEAEPGARLALGVERETSPEELRSAAQSGGLEELLRWIPVQKGDVFFIPAGQIHALGAGILVAEVQENSDTTYRLYDYNRRDKDGGPRPLHLDEALEAAILMPYRTPELPQATDGRQRLCECPYFTVDRIRVHFIADKYEGAFRLLFMTEGSGEIHANGEVYPVMKGETWFFPAGLREARILIQGEALWIAPCQKGIL